MFSNIHYGSKTLKSENIDMCSVQENCAWVIDGADSIFSTHISDHVSDADWFVKELNQHLKKNLMTQYLSISEIMKNGMRSITRDFLKFSHPKDMCDLDYPSAACAIVRVRDHKLSYFILGNCEMVLHYNDGNVIHLSDLRLQELDAKLMEVCQHARRKQRIPLYQTRKFMDHMMVENRLHRNIEGGYFVVGEDEMVVDYAIKGTVPLENIQSIYLICNGFSQYFNHKKVMQTRDEYLEKIRNEDLVISYEKMLSHFKKNHELARYMQSKLSGESTMVSFDIDKEALMNGG